MIVGMSEVPAKSIKDSKTVGWETVVIKTPVQVTIPGDINTNHTALYRKLGKVALS